MGALVTVSLASLVDLKLVPVPVFFLCPGLGRSRVVLVIHQMAQVYLKIVNSKWLKTIKRANISAHFKEIKFKLLLKKNLLT